MHLEFLVEELSTEAALRYILPKMISSRDSFRIHPHQGKPDLLRKLPRKLRSYGQYMHDDWRIIILLDEDRQDCKELKKRLEDMARHAGLVTKTGAGSIQDYQVMNRIAIEELEAWFFGDLEAIRKVYPRVSSTLTKKKQYRNPDAIKGGTSEALDRVLKKAGYYPDRFPKIEVARKISVNMDPERNISKSFQVFRDAIVQLTGK